MQSYNIKYVPPFPQIILVLLITGVLYAFVLKKIPLIMEIIIFLAMKIQKSPESIANSRVNLIQIATFGHFVSQFKEGAKGFAT